MISPLEKMKKWKSSWIVRVNEIGTEREKPGSIILGAYSAVSYFYSKLVIRKEFAQNLSECQIIFTGVIDSSLYYLGDLS